jgi:polyhydroxyalkanoate synthesis repressor PhaR
MRFLKRYQNRKIYDTHQSCYVCKEEIFHMVQEGEDIQIIDNKTKTDITYLVLLDIIFEREKKSEQMDTDLLVEIIRHFGTFTNLIKKSS